MMIEYAGRRITWITPCKRSAARGKTTLPFFRNYVVVQQKNVPSITKTKILIRDIKVSSAKWMKESGFFPRFRGWGIKYCALTYSYKERAIIINYIKNQQEHHKQESFQDEIRRFFRENGIDLDEKWFWMDS